MIIGDLFQERGLALPPEGLGEPFWAWVWQVSQELDVQFFDDHPMAAADLRSLVSLFGPIPPDLEAYYTHTTPWGDQLNGVEIWTEHLEIARACVIRNVALTQAPWTAEGVMEALEGAPPLWPVHLSQKANVGAFSNGRGRISVINANIGLYLGCPLAVGLRNYVLMAVTAEIVWEQKHFQSYNEALEDGTVRAAGGWPKLEPPRHPLIDVYEFVRARRVN